MKLVVLVDNNTLNDKYYIGEPAVSYYIEVDGKKVLFDTGYSDVFIRNARKMNINVDNIDAKILLLPANAPAIKIVAIVIKNGNRPLHGTKLFVIIAINLSLGESIIRHPVTPHALHPNPMHIVIICFPLQHAFLKNPSILNAILGR